MLIWVTGHCNRAAVSRNRYGVEKTVDTHKILINAINFMFVFKKYDRQNHVWSFMTKYLRFLCKFTSWSCGCIEKQIRCWKNCWYSYNIDKCNKILCLSSRNMIDKTMCEVLWRNISDFYVNLRVEVGKHPQVLIWVWTATFSQVILAMYFYLGQE